MFVNPRDALLPYGTIIIPHYNPYLPDKSRYFSLKLFAPVHLMHSPVSHNSIIKEFILLAFRQTDIMLLPGNSRYLIITGADNYQIYEIIIIYAKFIFAFVPGTALRIQRLHESMPK